MHVKESNFLRRLVEKDYSTVRHEWKIKKSYDKTVCCREAKLRHKNPFFIVPFTWWLWNSTWKLNAGLRILIFNELFSFLEQCPPAQNCFARFFNTIFLPQIVCFFFNDLWKFNFDMRMVKLPGDVSSFYFFYFVAHLESPEGRPGGKTKCRSTMDERHRIGDPEVEQRVRTGVVVKFYRRILRSCPSFFLPFRVLREKENRASTFLSWHIYRTKDLEIQIRTTKYINYT